MGECEGKAKVLAHPSRKGSLAKGVMGPIIETGKSGREWKDKQVNCRVLVTPFLFVFTALQGS